jgi:hypothetical protein
MTTLEEVFLNINKELASDLMASGRHSKVRVQSTDTDALR